MPTAWEGARGTVYNAGEKGKEGEEDGRKREEEKGKSKGKKAGVRRSTCQQGKDSRPRKTLHDCRLLVVVRPAPASLSSLIRSRFIFMFYQPIALPSRGKWNSHMKTERQTPRKAFQRPLPRRGSLYNGAWTSATSPGRGQADFIPLNLICWAQKAANEQPASSESSIPLSKSSYQIGLKNRLKGAAWTVPIKASCWPSGHNSCCRHLLPRHQQQATSGLPLSPRGVPPCPS